MSNSINPQHNIHVPDGRGPGCSNVCEGLVVVGGAVAEQSGPVGVRSVTNFFGFFRYVLAATYPTTVNGAPFNLNLVPEVVTNPVGEGPEGVVVVVVVVVVLLVLETVVLLELETVVVDVPLRHWKKKSFRTVQTSPAAQTESGDQFTVEVCAKRHHTCISSIPTSNG